MIQNEHLAMSRRYYTHRTTQAPIPTPSAVSSNLFPPSNMMILQKRHPFFDSELDDWFIWFAIWSPISIFLMLGILFAIGITMKRRRRRQFLNREPGDREDEKAIKHSHEAERKMRHKMTGGSRNNWFNGGQANVTPAGSGAAAADPGECQAA